MDPKKKKKRKRALTFESVPAADDCFENFVSHKYQVGRTSSVFLAKWALIQQSLEKDGESTSFPISF